MLACFGLFHFMKDRKASKCLKITSFVYCGFRLMFTWLINIILFISLFTSSHITQNINANFDTVISLTNSCHLFYICTSSRGLTEFAEILDMSGESRRKLRKSIFGAIGFGTILTIPLVVTYFRCIFTQTFYANSTHFVVLKHYFS